MLFYGVFIMFLSAVFALILVRRDGLYDLADFFYKEAYREGAVSHWQHREQDSQQRRHQQGDRSRVEAEQRPSTASDRAGGRIFSVPGGGQEDSATGVKAAVMDLHGHSLPLAHAAVR